MTGPSPEKSMDACDILRQAVEHQQAGRLENPRFTTTRTRSGNGAFKYETALTMNVMNFITMPLALKMERRRFDAVKLQVANQVLRLALETRHSYFRAVAAEESTRYYGQVVEAASAAAEPAVEDDSSALTAH